MASAGDVKLIIGMTLEKAYNGYRGETDSWAGTGKEEWIHSQNILKKCLEYTKSLDGCEGVAFFSYRLFFSTKDGQPIQETQEEIAAFLPILNIKE